MKVLRIIGNILLGIILFALVFSLLVISRTKNMLEGELLQDTIKNTVDEISKNDMSLTESQKEVIDEMFEDSDASEIINMILTNYKNFKNEENFEVSYDDAYKFYSFLHKYKSYIKTSSDEDISKMTEVEFKKYFDDKKVDKFVKDAFGEFDKNFDQNTLNISLKVYTFATSSIVKAALVFAIVLFILFICLINWDFIKWMLIFGIDLIISGTFFILLFSAVETAKEMILKENVNIKINFASFLKSGIIQVLFGIILIVSYIIIKKKFYSKDINEVNKEILESN